MAEPGHHRYALVTGASTGIGAAFARRLARDGSNLILVARDRGRLETLASELREFHRSEVSVLPADLTQEGPLGDVLNAVASRRNLDLLVNNAGFATLGPFAKLDCERELSEIALNVTALVRLTQTALPRMISRRRGAIINVSSLAAFQPGPYNATYSATKAYVKSFSEALAEELRGTGVRVQVLCPGFTRTEFQARAGLDASRIPRLAWMGADAVVDQSLAALRRGAVVCVPGLANRVLAGVVSASPTALVRRVTGTLGRHLLA